MTQLKILALVHRVPFPPNKGEKIRAYHALKHLAVQGHAIDLATFADVEEDLVHGPALSGICRKVRIVKKDKLLGRARSLLELPRAQPLSVGYFQSFRLMATLRDWFREGGYDAAWCYSSPMAEFVRSGAFGGRASHLARVMDFCDVDSDKWKQYAGHTRQPMRSVYQLEAHRLAAYEREIGSEFDASTLVSPAEVETFQRIAPDARRVLSIPNGVDAEFFGETERRPAPLEAPVYVFIGQMDYFANIDGARYFAEQVMPRIRALQPRAIFQIVGRAPTAEVKKLAELPGVEVTGAVDDVRAYLGRATLVVAPLRIARGIQNKVLEAMAARAPLVASPAAFEGIEGKDGIHARVAADPESYAAAVVALSADASSQARLSEAARALVVSDYAWAPAMSRLEQLLLELVEEKRRSARARS